MNGTNKPKLPECDREAARLLAIQLSDKKSRRAGDLVLVSLFLAAIFAFAALFWILPDREKSERENRTLEQMPKLTLKTLTDHSFTEDIADYMADQFPGRDFFVTVKAAAETALLKGGNNGVIFGTGETLVTREDLPDTDNMRENLAAMSAFTDWCEDRGIPAVTAIAGRTADVLDHTLPACYGSAYSDRLWDTLSAQAAEEGIGIVNLRDPLRTRARAGEYVYYRTDHHWTTLGAYYGYADIAGAMGLTPAPLSDFDRRTVSLSFFGTTWSTAGASWIGADTMEFFRFPGDETYTTTIVDDGTSFKGFYVTDTLSVKDKYSAFLGGNHALVTVTQDGAENRETLLIFKDSFAHAAVPFLARHYNLVIADLRYYKKSPAALVGEYGADRVLFLYNIDSLTASASQRMLRAGIE